MGSIGREKCGSRLGMEWSNRKQSVSEVWYHQFDALKRTMESRGSLPTKEIALMRNTEKPIHRLKKSPPSPAKHTTIDRIVFSHRHVFHACCHIVPQRKASTVKESSQPLPEESEPGRRAYRVPGSRCKLAHLGRSCPSQLSNRKAFQNVR